MAEEEEVNLKTLSEKELLLRIAQELGTIRKKLISGVNAQLDAEKEVPEFMRRFMMYMHDMRDMISMYREIGADTPDYVLREIERCDDRLRQLLTKLHTDGGQFEKVRQEMAQDPDNRWDHTRLLTKGK